MKKEPRIATLAGVDKYGAPIGTPIKAAIAAKKAKAAAAKAAAKAPAPGSAAPSPPTAPKKVARKVAQAAPATPSTPASAAKTELDEQLKTAALRSIKNLYEDLAGDFAAWQKGGDGAPQKKQVLEKLQHLIGVVQDGYAKGWEKDIEALGEAPTAPKTSPGTPTSAPTTPAAATPNAPSTPTPTPPAKKALPTGMKNAYAFGASKQPPKLPEGTPEELVSALNQVHIMNNSKGSMGYPSAEDQKQIVAELDKKIFKYQQSHPTQFAAAAAALTGGKWGMDSKAMEQAFDDLAETWKNSPEVSLPKNAQKSAPKKKATKKTSAAPVAPVAPDNPQGKPGPEVKMAAPDSYVPLSIAAATPPDLGAHLVGSLVGPYTLTTGTPYSLKLVANRMAVAKLLKDTYQNGEWPSVLSKSQPQIDAYIAEQDKQLKGDANYQKMVDAINSGDWRMNSADLQHAVKAVLPAPAAAKPKEPEPGKDWEYPADWPVGADKLGDPKSLNGGAGVAANGNIASRFDGTDDPKNFSEGHGKAWARSVWKWPGMEFTSTERAAITSYTGGGYTDMNSSLRSGNMSPSMKAKVRALRQAINKAPRVPQEIVVTRTAKSGTLDFLAQQFGPPPAGIPLNVWLAQKLEPGTTFKEPGFTSTAVNGDDSYLFGGAYAPARFRFTIPEGSRGLYVSNGLSPVGNGENELILDTGASFEVTKVELGPSGGPPLLIHATLLSQDGPKVP